MKLTLLLDKMTTAEKRLALEAIWEALCRTPDNVPSPAWHGRVLEETSSSPSVFPSLYTIVLSRK